MGSSHRLTGWGRRDAILAVVATLATLATVFTLAGPNPEASASTAQQFIPSVGAGDVDCDGEMTAADALQLLRVVVEQDRGRQSCARVGEVEINLGRGDLDGDGEVSAVDVLIIMRCVAGFTNPPCPGVAAVPLGFGDVNCDGVFDTADADLLSDLGRRPEPTGSLCDPNDDSVLDLSVGDFTRNGEVTRADGKQAEFCFVAYARPLQIRLDDICPRIGNEAPLAVGDADCNGVIDSNDAAAIVDYVNGFRRGLQTCIFTGSGGGVVNLERSELNRDGVVDLNDAAVIESCLSEYDFRTCPNWMQRDVELPVRSLNSPWRGDLTCDAELSAADTQALNSFLLNGVGADDLTCGTTSSPAWNASRGDMDGDRVLTYEDLVLLEDCRSRISDPRWPCPVDGADLPAPRADATSPAIGDVDCDGRRTRADAVFMQEYLDGIRLPSGSCASLGDGRLNEARADVNGDGRIGAPDVRLLLACIDDPTAASCPARSCGAADAVPADCVHEQRVLSLRFIPIDPENPLMLDPWALSEFDIQFGQHPTIQEVLAKIIENEPKGIELISNASRHLLRQNPDAPASLEFDIVASRNIFERPPIGLPYFDTFRPDYEQMLTRPDIDVCDWVDNQGIDEVWLWTMHTADIEPAETNMSSRSSLPFTDISNSEGTDDLPHCERTYVVYNHNFRREADGMLHIRGHHMEALLKWRPDDRQVFVYDGYQGRGASYEELAAPLGFYRCGNIHRPPNAPLQELPGEPVQHSWLDRSLESDCPNWKRTGGEPVLVNCSTWFEPYYGSPTCFQDFGVSWFTYWFQGLPGMANGIIDEGRQWRNVFDAIGEPDRLLTSASYLFETEQLEPEQANSRGLVVARDYFHHDHEDDYLPHVHDE